MSTSVAKQLAAVKRELARLKASVTELKQRSRFPSDVAYHVHSYYSSGGPGKTGGPEAWRKRATAKRRARTPK